MPRPHAQHSAIVTWARRSVSVHRTGSWALGEPLHSRVQSVARLDRPPRDALVRETITLLRDAHAMLRSSEATGYDRTLAWGWQVADLTTAAASTLAPRVTPASPHRADAIDALLDGLTHPVQGWCHPACCSAATVRLQQQIAREHTLVAARRIDTECGTRLDRDLVTELLCESPRRIAVPMADLLWRSSAASQLHEAPLVAGLDSRNWPVVELCIRGLGNVSSLRRSPPFIRMLRHARWQIRESAVRALAPEALSPRVRKRLEQLLHDHHPRVRSLARARLEPQPRYLDP